MSASRATIRGLGAQLDVGVNVGRYAQARIGYVYDSAKVEVDIGSPLMPEQSPIDAGVVVSAEFDSRDTAFSPTRGLAAALEYMQSDRFARRAIGIGSAPSWVWASLCRFDVTCCGSRSPAVRSERRSSC